MHKNNKGGGKTLPLIVIGIIVVTTAIIGGLYLAGQNKGSQKDENSSGITYTKNEKQSVKIPENFPKHIPVHAGIKLENAWNSSNNESDSGDSTGKIKAGYMGTIEKPCEEVKKWYADEMKKKGWKIDIVSSGGVTASNASEVGSIVTTDMGNSLCSISVSLADLANSGVSSSSGDQGHEQIIEDLKQMEELQKEMDAMEQ